MPANGLRSSNSRQCRAERPKGSEEAFSDNTQPFGSAQSVCKHRRVIGSRFQMDTSSMKPFVIFCSGGAVGRMVFFVRLDPQKGLKHAFRGRITVGSPSLKRPAPREVIMRKC